MSGIENTARVLFDMVGKEGKRVLDKKQFLEGVARIDENMARQIEEGVKGVTNPTFEMSGKATANYNVASLKIKDAKGDVVGGGAVSANDLFSHRVSLKSRLDLPNGKLSRGASIGADNFLLESGDGFKLLYNQDTGKIVAHNNVCNKIAEVKYYNGRLGGREFSAYNSEGERIRAFWIDADGTKNYTKLLPDGTEIWLDRDTRVVLKNKMENRHIVLNKGNDSINIEGYCDSILDRMSLDKRNRITSISFIRGTDYNPEEYIGKKLTPELQKKLGIEEMFNIMKEIPEQERFLKEVVEKAAFEHKPAGSKNFEMWFAVREHTENKANAELMKKVESTPKREQPVSPEVQREQIVRDTAGMSFRDLLKLAFSRKKKPNSDVMEKIESTPKREQPVSPEVQREQIVRDTADMSPWNIIKSLFNNK